MSGDSTAAGPSIIAPQEGAIGQRRGIAGYLANARAVGPGLLVTLVIALAATVLARFLPLVGAAVIAIVIGMACRQIGGLPGALAPGIRSATKRVLQVAIVLLGTNLSLTQVWATGRASALVMLGTLIFGLALIIALGRVLHIERTLTRLIAAGTAICGASAIGALAPAIDADQAAVAYAISTVFLFNIGGVLLFPPLGHALHLSARAFGLWAGTAINDTSSVVAAGYIYGQVAGTTAVVVKLTRSVMIVPVVVFFAALSINERRQHQTGQGWRSLARGLPVFIVWFIVASALNSIGLFSVIDSRRLLPVLGQFLIVMALAGVGLSANLPAMLRTGLRPVLLGLIGWIGVAATSLLLQHLSGGL